MFKFVLLLGFALGLSPLSVYALLDDPMRPPGYRLHVPGKKKYPVTSRYWVSLVQISAVKRIAVVNDRFVREGDVINGAKVIAINPSSVKLKKKGKVFTVKLVSQRLKKKRVQ